MPNEEGVLDEDSNLKSSNLDKKKQRDTKESDIEISSLSWFLPCLTFVIEVKTSSSVTLLQISRAIFSWVLKANRNCIEFALLRCVIGPEQSHHSLNQSDSKLTASQDLVTSVFPRFMQFTWFYFELPLAPYCIFLPSDWLLWSLRFWLYDTQSKSALTVNCTSVLKFNSRSHDSSNSFNSNNL